MEKEILIILAISVLGPVLGSLIGVFKKPSDTWINNMLAFAAGVMIAVSLLELVPGAVEISSTMIAMGGFLFGFTFMYLLDISIPHIHRDGSQEQGRNLKRTSLFLIIGIFLHNFPEGMALALGEIIDFETALIVAIGIAVHSIPEGICTSAPYYKATKRRLHSFLVSSSTVIPIVIGFAVATYLFGLIPVGVSGFILAATAGFMVYISADELIPTALASGNGKWEHPPIFSIMFGILLIMGLRLIG